MRYEKFDLLRFIGLAMIILAHSGTHGWLFQLRNFDVPLMVLLSGAVFGLSYKGEKYADYVWKRFKRLVLPVWIFLSIYFSLMYLIDFPSKLPSLKTVISSYGLVNGIGYVWVIRVFLLMALIAPTLYWYNKKQASTSKYFRVLLIIYFIYEVIIFARSIWLGSEKESYLFQTFFYLISYGCIFALGLRLTILKTRDILWLIGFFLAMFMIFCIYHFYYAGHFVQTQSYKYPPSGYYITYALAIGLILWLLADYIFSIIQRFKMSKLILFIAQNSIWIYLWHIPFIEMLNCQWYFKFPIVLLGATGVTYVQFVLVTKYLEPSIRDSIARKNVHLILTG